MTETEQANHRIGITRLARTIIVATSTAGGTITRGELRKGFGRLTVRPTIGEVTDALVMLRSSGAASLKINSYIDFNDCVITLT